jgi:hypothetical protein
VTSVQIGARSRSTEPDRAATGPEATAERGGSDLRAQGTSTCAGRSIGTGAHIGSTNFRPRRQAHRSWEIKDGGPGSTIFAGAHIKQGDYSEGKGITHVNILRTLEVMYDLPRAGAQQPNAAGGAILP